jgi:hypothetical protein
MTFLVYRDAPVRGFYPSRRRLRRVRGWEPQPVRFHPRLRTVLYYSRKDVLVRG